MKAKHKIINDPVYGFITLPYGILYDVVDHPFFQRLRRIKQLGLSHYVYPGAVNTRFHHALGAFHLSRQTIHSLRQKGVKISTDEALGLQLAILLHDIGHGPYSHSLERLLIPLDHESISLKMMEILNSEFDGKLDIAIKIFKGTYHRNFFHQLISGQLDMDRMDYLIRDSYFTGVAEGVIGYDRIIKMMNVKDDQLVIELKGIYSIEKFLMARRLMYWQVYLHKAVLAADKMLRQIISLYLNKEVKKFNSPLVDLHNKYNEIDSRDDSIPDELIKDFSLVDDTEVNYLIKQLRKSEDEVISYLAKCVLDRKLIKMSLFKQAVSHEMIEDARNYCLESLNFSEDEIDKVIFFGSEKNSLYKINSEEISILMKDGTVKPFSEMIDNPIKDSTSTRYYLGFPRISKGSV